MFRRSAGRLWKAHDAELQTEAWDKVSAEAENQLQVRSDGAYVPPLSWQTVEGA